MQERIKDIPHKLQMLHKYFFRSKPHEGPIEETDLGIRYLDLNLDQLYEQILSYSSKLQVEILGEVRHHSKSYPLYKVTKDAPVNSPRLLVLSALHGNEQAASLAVPPLLQDLTSTLHFRNTHVSVVTPINPVGVDHKSRYNGQGLDINRDFRRFRTKEAAIVRDVVEDVRPNFVVSLHEGPQTDGTFLYVNKFVDKEMSSGILKDLEDKGILLADRDFLGRKLKTPGIQSVDSLILVYGLFCKHVLGLQNSGHFLRDRQIPLITIETPWRNPDTSQRIDPHIEVIRGVVKRLKEAS